MKYRLTAITTTTGDDGTTSLANGSRLPKYDIRIEVLGEVDELNSVIGMVIVQSPMLEAIKQNLLIIQHQLFDLGGELSMPSHKSITEQNILQLETWLEQLNQTLPPLKEFILPGGNIAAATCHLARTVCRRLERHLWQLNTEQSISQLSLVYINRLSDLLFVIARILARQTDEEVYWKKQEKR